ncbi:MAG: NADH-quinone oxidoreductase subunit N [Myxococcales bacterium]|nr:NADH-quinone oxidoreductase subunit N [Myxococcales bacterium]MCB9522930.1 NADH-quinone oxidoreductase subunit N [Myxococcales bacterium]
MTDTSTLTNFAPLVLDLMVVFTALLVLATDILLPAGRKKGLGQLTAVALAGILGLSFVVDTSGLAFSGAYEGSAWTLFFKRLFLGVGALVALGGTEHVDQRYPGRQGELWLLLLSTLLGMMLLPGARNLILFVVAFELMGLPLVLMAAWPKTEDADGPGRKAPEAALKLYVVSAASTAITGMGMALLFGASGSLALADLAGAPQTPLLWLGLFTVIAGLSFKVGAVPFHQWVPDTYEGAPTPVVGFLSVAPKAAGLAAFALILLEAFGSAQARWLPVMLFLTVITLVVGNALAVPQNDAKRLLAYSGIAQIGYMLIAVVIGTEAGQAVLLFYLAGYAVTNLGAFLVIEAVTGDAPDADLGRFAGLYQRAPGLAFALLIFLLSLAGIPFVVGFWAKLYVFMAAYEAGLGWLVGLGAALSILALFYYLRLAKAVYLRSVDDPQPVAAGGGLKLAIWLCLAGTIGFGAWPAPVVDAARAAAAAFGG